VSAQVSDFSLIVFYGYLLDTYPSCIGYVSISGAYPARIRASAAVSV
jgi:hypothetical protein